MFISKSMQVFITLYQEKSLKTAADKLCLTVPPVSRMLKLTEGWVGEQLFIIERNNITPTPAADCIYQQLLPLYMALKNMTRRHPEQQEFLIASPYISTSILSDLLTISESALPKCSSIKYAECIHPDDDIYISLQPVECPMHFEPIRMDLVLELCCSKNVGDKWLHMPILAESETKKLKYFQRSLAELHARGGSGVLRQVDNPSHLQSTFKSGEGLLFRLPPKNTMVKDYQSLPVISHCPLFIYVNTLKKDKRHNCFTAKLKELLP
ncbi:LysR family transcriptional regulator [Erwinia pyrifoliae]|uniref:LysR family transcriptional regulator n=1 Tax=Erwinia pyrifoliae TaxID=79967 RepID=A0ABY5X6U1_ERWPY|nr:LysR family transcriptional regulator [Erwinia pyrifoliae]MCT2386034.1 LysR family transcriptional regulator [Erwinia pyrifoliae]MCU8588380.1 LysR family transcriptional regulator [Erwinia pyrifoliae]UWS29875.1 LysR family transcriptional regulator [Erwinia pyrifoliae]UWS33101.1 LysR family transcriptional regulator [Erwinia pyrifoliae]